MAELNHYEKLVDMLRHPTMYKDIPMLSEIADDIEGLLAACDNYSDTIKELVDELEKVEHKHGKWLRTPTYWAYCSCCGEEPPSESNFTTRYCPNCGAEMETYDEVI